MSGGGGSGSDSGYKGGGASSGAACSTLAFDANVASPDPTVASTIGIDDVLDVAIVGTPPQIALFTSGSALLGALTDHWIELTECDAAGFTYEATVIRLAPAIRVHVQPKR